MSVKKGSYKYRVLMEIVKQPSLANNDADLVIHMWYLDGWLDSRNLIENYKNMKPASYIERMRRELHQEGYIKYSPQIEEQRYRSFIRELDKRSNLARWFADRFN